MDIVPISNSQKSTRLLSIVAALITGLHSFVNAQTLGASPSPVTQAQPVPVAGSTTTGQPSQSVVPKVVPVIQIPQQIPAPSQTQQLGNGINPEMNAILNSLLGGGYRSRYLPVNQYGRSEFATSSGDSFSGGSEERFTAKSFDNIKPTGSSDLNSPFKILGPFKKYFDDCVEKANLGKCKFVNLGVKGDKSHQARRSCHNSAQAIDVGPLTCSTGKKVTASDPQYFEVAKCMANRTNDELQVIFYKSEGKNMIKKSDHNNHMHIQLKNCSMVYG